MAELSLEDLKASYFGYLKKHLEIMGDPNHKTVQEHLKQLQHYPNAEDECLEVTFHAAETDRFEVPETFRYEDINDLSHPLLIQGKKLIGVSETNHEDEIIDLSDYRYHHAIVFKDCIIGGNHPNFKTIFKNAAHTAYADIFERVFFDNCTFTDETEFTSLHLMRGLRFHNCIFQKNVSMANLDSGDERLAKEYPSYNSTIRINKCLFHANLNLNNIGVRDCFEVENGCIYGRLKITCLTAKKLILKQELRRGRLNYCFHE